MADLLNAHSIAEVGRPDTTVVEVREEWRRPDRDPDRDLIVAEVDGRVVGYLELDVRPPWTSVRLDGYVHPAWWGRGIGTDLLRLGEDRARDVTAREAPGRRVVVYHGVWQGGPGGPLLGANGFRLARVFWEMEIDLAEAPPPPRWPPGVTVRAPVPGEEPAIHQAMEEAFADHWEHRPVALDRWVHDHRAHPGYDPALWFLAVDGHQIAGGAICHSHTSEDPDRALVDDLAVRRPWRRGIALALLRHAFGEFHRRGIPGAILTVDSDNPTGAPRVYERAGMQVRRRIDVYGKELVADS